MSKDYKAKARHFYPDFRGSKRRFSHKIKWSVINKIRRHNYDWDLDRAEWAALKDKSSLRDMKQQIKENISN